MAEEVSLTQVFELLVSMKQSLDARFDTLETRFDTLEKRFDTLETRVSDVEGEVGDIKIAHTKLDQRMATLEAGQMRLEQGLKDVFFAVNALRRDRDEKGKRLYYAGASLRQAGEAMGDAAKALEDAGHKPHSEDDGS